MKASELILKLIDHYEKVIPLVKQGANLNECREICLKNSVHIGICQCTYELFKIDIYKHRWVNSLEVFNYYWGPTVRLAESKEEIITFLTFRLEVMKQIVRKWMNG